MNPPYPPTELDALLRAAIAFERDHSSQFYAGNLAGREGVGVDSDVVKRMAEWLATTDEGLMANLGFGADNLTYFRVGNQANAVMADGGMARYFERKRRSERLEKAKGWLPIVISIIAVTFTALTYFGPRSAGARLGAAEREIAVLEATAAAHTRALDAEGARADTLEARLREVRQSGPRR